MESKLWGDVPGHSEVWILIYGTRNKASDVPALSEHVRKTRRKAGCCLNCCKCNLSNVVGKSQSKDCMDSTPCDQSAQGISLSVLAQIRLFAQRVWVFG